MKPVEKPRNSNIVVREKQGGRTVSWEVVCGDCGSVVATKPFPSKDTATKAAVKHDKEAHNGQAVIRIRS